VATRKPASKEDVPDFNTAVATAVLEITGMKRVRGEDLIADPKLKKKFRELKKQTKDDSLKKNRPSS
jgi:hypothetical protein